MKRSFKTNLRHIRPYTIIPFDVARSACAEYCERGMTVFFSRRAFTLMWLVLVMLVSSCTNTKTSTRSGEESVSSTSSTPPVVSKAGEDAGPPPSCGREVVTHGQGYDEAARKCLWDAYQAGKTAELALTRHTIEGDPITLTLRVRSASAIDVVEDNRDRFGARGVRNASCKVLERSPSVNGHSGFVVRGCSGGVETIEVP